MSAQTGVETPRGPASQRLNDRMKYRVRRWTSNPNPLWIREMRQSARLQRTPIILMVITILVTLMMASLGGALTGTTSPASAGSALFHTYFSLAYFVVTLVGPALAANSIASEREGKTWEAVLLTGMRPSEVARGKFLSAYTSIGMYIVMLAPVGALPFLFGGVTPVEVVTAFALLFLIALLSVAFGLAISSKMGSLRGALLVTLLVAIPLSGFCYGTFGVGGSAAAHEIWDVIEAGPPVWLPTAYARAPFGMEYVVYLLAIPVAGVALPAWLLYEVTRSNLTSVTDDRSYGLKRWFLVTSIVLASVAAVPMFAVEPRDRSVAIMFGIGFYVLFVIFCCFLFAAEAVGPSRRVKQMLEHAGVLRKALSPGVMKVASLQLLVAIASFVLLGALGVVFVQVVGGPRSSTNVEQIIIFTLYAAGFTAFVIGLSAMLRSRNASTAVARVLLLVVLFFMTTGPWILAAITGVLSGPGSSDDALAVAAPSPIYAIVAVDAIGKPDPGITVLASIVASLCYAGVGVLLLLAAGIRCRRVIREHEAVLAEADRRLHEEDVAREQERAEQERAATERAEQPEAAGDESEGEDQSEDQGQSEGEGESESESDEGEGESAGESEGDEGESESDEGEGESAGESEGD